MSAPRSPEERPGEEERLADARRRSRIRPSRAERAPYTDALAQGVAEGRLTQTLYEERVGSAVSAASFAELDELVADLPFEPPHDTDAEADRTRPGRLRIAGLSAIGVVTAGVTFAAAAAVVGADHSAASTDSAVESREEAEQPGDRGEPPPIADELDAVAPMDDSTVSEALDRAAEAGLTDIEQIVLDEDATSVIGLNEEDELRQLYLQPHDVGVLSEASDASGVHIDQEALDLDPAAAIEEARAASDAEPDQEVRTILVYRGDGSQEREGEEGNLVQVSFSGGPDVTLRADDLTVLW